MPGAWNYPDLAELENFISRLTLQAAEEVSEQARPAAPFVDNLSLRRILIIEEWGEGTAVFGETPMTAALFFGFTGPDNRLDDVTDAVTEQMTNIIDGGEILVPQDLREGTGGIRFIGGNINDLDDALLSMATRELEMVFDLTNQEAINIIGGRSPNEYPRIPVEELREDEEEVEEEADVDEETPDIPSGLITDPEAIPEVILPGIEEEPEDLGPEFPEIDPNLRPFAVDSDTLEIPAGKETKEIEPRDPFDFEVEMALPGVQISGELGQRTIEEIAIPVAIGTLGSDYPVGTFPRTGVYIRNYLKFRGPAYSYEIYKNLVFYSGFISTLHGINVKAGTYQTFREYMYVLEEIEEREGIPLVDALTQQQAAGEGLETVPDHPSIEGAKAPWLQRRQYYDLVEENDDHPAWRNAYDFLHGDEEE